MPRARFTGWDGSPNYRWVKMYKGQRHRITCEELHLPRDSWTEDGSMKAAKEWWAKKQAEIDGSIPRALDDLANLAGEIGIIKAKQAIVREQMDVDAREAEVIAVLPGFKEKLDGAFETAKAKLVYVPVATEFSLRHHETRFLELERDRITRANTFGDLWDYIPKIVDFIGAETDARTINEATVDNVRQWLPKRYKTSGTRKKSWGFFKRLVRHLWKQRIIAELPRNLDDKLGDKFKVKAKKVKRYELGEVKQVVNALPERLKLYALLGLNCGMTGMDMASFTKSQLDTKNWRITRKRTKTEETEDVPEVAYKLWPITAKLLKKQMADHPTLVLTSKANTPLVTVWIDETTGKRKKKDLISLQWKRKKLSITLKAFRSIGATIIGDEKEKGYGRFYHHFLAHSPKSIGDKHYVPPSVELFDEIMAYVGKTLGFS